MVHTTTPPRQFFFQCPTCDRYPVSEETLRQFLTPELKRELERALARGAHGARLAFDGNCPRCEPNSTYNVELAVLWPRKN